MGAGEAGTGTGVATSATDTAAHPGMALHPSIGPEWQPAGWEAAWIASPGGSEWCSMHPIGSGAGLASGGTNDSA